MKHISQKRTLLILLAYIALALIMTWPLIAQLDTHIPGDAEREDHWQHQWTFWWVKEAITTGQNPFYTRLMFYPDGTSLTSHNFAWLNIVAWLPLQALVGPTAAYNLLFITIFILNSIAVYLLARDVTRSEWPSFVAGLVFAYWPYTISHFDHPNLILVAWIPLALLFMRRTLRTKARRDLILASFFIVLTGITRWQLLIPAGLVLGFYLIWTLATDRTARNWTTLRQMIWIALISGLLLIPLAIPILQERMASADTSLLMYFEEDGQVDLLAYITPSRYHPIWGQSIRHTSLFNSFRYNTLYIPFIGFTTLFLAIVGFVTGKRMAAVWGFMALFFVLLALGPVLRIGGQLFPQVPLPFRLVEDLFFFRLIRRTDRFNIILSLPVAMLVSFGMLAIRNWFRKPLQKNGITLILTGLILFEALPVPFPTTSIDITPIWYQQLSKEPGEFAIIDLPLARVPTKYYLFYQTSHHKPVVEGRLSRIPEGTYHYITEIPFLAYLFQPNRYGAPQGDISQQIRTLSEDNVRYIVVHKDLFPPEQLTDFLEWFPLEPVFEDSQLIVYRTDTVDSGP